jgi:hypothetical protein
MIARLLVYFVLLLNPWATRQQPMGYGGTPAAAGNHIVLQNGCSARNTGATTSFAIAIFGATNCNATSYVPAINDMIVIYWGLGPAQASITSCSDTNSNTWTIVPFGGGSNRSFVSRSKLTTGGNTTVTCSWPTSGAVIALEGDFSGAQNVLDPAATINFQINSSGTSQSTPALTTTNANDVVLGCFTVANNATATGYTAVAPFVAYAGLSNTNINGYCEYNIVTATSTYTPQFTLSSASAGQSMTMALESQ